MCGTKTRFASLSRFSPSLLAPPSPPPYPLPRAFRFLSRGVFLSAVKLRHVEIMIIARWAQKSGIGMQTFNSSVGTIRENDLYKEIRREG